MKRGKKTDAKSALCVRAAPLRSFTHFLTGVCAIIGGVFTGQSPPPPTESQGSDFFFYYRRVDLTSFSSLDSRRPDRLAHLPLGSGHPEEDRAGQGILTAPPLPLPPLPPAAWPPVVQQHRPGLGDGKEDGRTDGRTDKEREEPPVGTGREAERLRMPLSLFLLWINTDKEIFSVYGIYGIRRFRFWMARRNGGAVGWTLTRGFQSEEKMHRGGWFPHRRERGRVGGRTLTSRPLGSPL